MLRVILNKILDFIFFHDHWPRRLGLIFDNVAQNDRDLGRYAVKFIVTLILNYCLPLLTNLSPKSGGQGEEFICRGDLLLGLDR